MRRADFWTGLALLAFAGFYYQQSLFITVGLAADRLGPTFFPRLLAVTLALAALALLLRAARGRSDPEPLPAARLGLFLWAVGLTAGYALLLARAGYLIATPAYLAAVVWLLGFRNPAGVAATALGITAGLYLVFVRALHVLVPMGPLGR